VSALDRARDELARAPRTWLLTGPAGFIGSNLLETLLGLGQTVVGLDDLSTGRRENLEAAVAGAGGRGRFRLVEGDVRDPAACRAACEGVDLVCHQAAMVSVPRSVDDPQHNQAVNEAGFVNVLDAARRAGVSRVVYASSSAVYGDDEAERNREDALGEAISPYGLSKRVNELYAGLFGRMHGVEACGLRYFNVFGPRQDPASEYSAVIPRWTSSLLAGRRCTIFGDGENTRDFCHVDDVVQANLLAATAPGPAVAGRRFNVARGERTSLNRLHDLIRDALAAHRPELAGMRPEHAPFRPGDIRHSVADVSLIRGALGYEPRRTLAEGLRETLAWYAGAAGGAA
jgi:UDP-N-acetylglucosamine 4-epimerase